MKPTSDSHVGHMSTTSSSDVEDKKPTISGYPRGTSLVTYIHIIQTPPIFSCHVGDMSLATTSHVGGIDNVDKPK
jgi:hypothetical protein